MNSLMLFACALLSFVVAAMAAGVGDFFTAVLMMANVMVCLIANEVME